MMNKFSQICTPAKLYFAIAVISCILALVNHMPIISVVMKLLFAFAWTFILSLICKKGFTLFSWVLVLLPFIMILLSYLGVKTFESFENKKKEDMYSNMKKKEGMYSNMKKNK